MNGGEDFLRVIKDVTLLHMKNTQTNNGSAMVLVLDDSNDIVGVLDVLRELHPGEHFVTSIVLMPKAPRINYSYTVMDLINEWNETAPATKLIHLCRCYRALFQGRSNIATGSTQHISLDAVMAIAGIYGIAVER
ncbi:hypothetical protein Bpfe_031123 [Biomphalaria pfeifferi]|uniref:Uncharacterized protein n=1 Tax=Biomphalaria pfeifferi TaxID=112525 RepID=A0AAD8ANH0_BIOPF|nr:hypothetical protein Bpfe_031123 [Biomphalaria pfeifferi]